MFGIFRILDNRQKIKMLMPCDESIISFHKESMLGNFAHLQKKMSQEIVSWNNVQEKRILIYFFHVC